MATWATKKLKDITTKIGSGATPRGGKGAYHREGTPLIRSLNIYDLNFTYDNLAFIDDSQAKQLANVTVEKDDVLLNITGASVCRCASVPDNLIPARVNQHVSIIRADRKTLLGKYLKYALVSPLYKQALFGLATTGATREALTKSDIENFEIKLPDVEMQRQISSILSAYDDLIENNEKRIKALEEMAQLLYTEWFVKFKFPGHEKAQMVDSGTEYGMIPEGWEVKNLGEIAKEIRESINPKVLDPETYYVGLEHIPRKTILLSDWGKASDINSSKLIFRIGDVLFGKIRPYFHKAVSAPFDGISSSDTVIIRANKPLLQTLVLMCVSNTNFVAYATNNSQGTKMPRADWKSMSKYRILLPDESILNVFSIRVSQIVTQINILMFQNKNLSKTRDLLIPQLVTGKRILK